MTDEPQVHAHLGHVILPTAGCGGYGCSSEHAYTPEATWKLIAELSEALKQAQWQQAQIRATCAQGHTWDDGYNHTWGDKVTIYHCTREGCDGRKEEPGWLPFEPKQHQVLYRHQPVDCTGPGCEHCGNEAFAEAFHKILANISIERAPNLWETKEITP